jgi:Domain of unknown function (DUF4145)
MAVNAYTTAVMAARKLLMNVAVSQGANPGDTFVNYINYFDANGYIPPNGRQWVDHIRTKGNEATHEINPMTRPEAEAVLTFVEMMLKLVFEYPAKVPPSGSAGS